MNVTLDFFFEKISENGRGRPRPLRESENFFLFYIHHLWSQLLPRTKIFKKYVTVLRTADDRHTDRRTDGLTHEHSENINIDYTFITHFMTVIRITFIFNFSTFS